MVQAYDVKLRKKVEIKNPQIVQMKNGRYALKGVSAESGNTLFRIVSKKDIEKNKYQKGDGFFADLLGLQGIPLINMF
jgi:hypothetical protein